MTMTVKRDYERENAETKYLAAARKWMDKTGHSQVYPTKFNRNQETGIGIFSELPKDYLDTLVLVKYEHTALPPWFIAEKQKQKDQTLAVQSKQISKEAAGVRGEAAAPQDDAGTVEKRQLFYDGIGKLVSIFESEYLQGDLLRSFCWRADDSLTRARVKLAETEGNVRELLDIQDGGEVNDTRLTRTTEFLEKLQHDFAELECWQEACRLAHRAMVGTAYVPPAKRQDRAPEQRRTAAILRARHALGMELLAPQPAPLVVPTKPRKKPVKKAK